MTARATLLTLLLAWAGVAAAPFDDRMTLVEAIDAVRSMGHDVSYSTQLVKDWMRVRQTPDTDDAVEALDAALEEYGLGLSAGPGGRWLVVRSESQPDADTTVTVDGPERERKKVPAPPAIEEITVVASHHALFSRDENAEQFLSGDDIRLMPHIGDDAFRALHRLPGVAASDFQAPFNLRGGAVDEVAVTIDGLEIIEPYHMRTLFQPLSIIDPGIIGQVEVFSGGFTARHGNYMSGVVDIETRRQQSAPVHEVGVSFVSAFARSGGDFADGRGNYFVSARRGYLDLIANELEGPGEELAPRYADGFSRVAWRFSPALELSLSALLAQDDVEFSDTLDGESQREDSDYSYLWLSADYDPGGSVSSSTKLFTSNIETTQRGSKFEPQEQDILRFDHRKTRVTGVQTDWTIRLNDRHLLLLGARHRDLEAEFDYRLDALRTTIFVNNGLPFLRQRDIQTRSRGEDSSLYASYRFRPSDPLTVEVGARWDRQTWLGDGTENQVSPRLNLRYELGEQAEMRLAWGRFHQPQAIQDLQVEDGETTYHGVEEAEHRGLGFRYRFDGGRMLQLDLYDKRYRNLRRRYENFLDIYEFAPESNFDRLPVDPERGRAYGAELTLVDRTVSNLKWWLNYTWSKADDVIDSIDVPRSWDQRHAVTANLTWTGDRWSFSATARWRSGWPRTPLIASGIFDDNGDLVGIVSDLSRRNTDSLDDYVRLDLRVSRFVPLTRGSFEYYFELFNVFDTENQCCVTHHDLAIGTTVSATPEFDEFLPRFPSFGFVWRFGSGAQ